MGVECEATILNFERERKDRVVSFDEIDGLLNAVPTRYRDIVICEMARIDLERRIDSSPNSHECQRGASPFVDHYIDTFSKDRWRNELAFEHFRLTEHSGANVSRRECASMYGVVAASWITASDSKSNVQIGYPKPGEVFCGYPLLAELGRGAIARVFLARQPDLAERLVVLKVTERKTLEADNLASFQHSNIVPVYSIHRENNLYCICMPFLGILTVADLAANLNEQGSFLQPSEKMISTVVAKRLSTIRFGELECQVADVNRSVPSYAMNKSHSQGSKLAQVDVSNELGGDQLTKTLTRILGNQSQSYMVIDIISGVIDGIAYSHFMGVTHCDMKPENILIANDGHPVLLDFNLSRRSGEQEPQYVGGTVAYMSPQRLRSLDSNGEGKPSDDIFAIGVILYQLLTGHMPFPQDSQRSLSMHELASIREEKTDRMQQQLKQISPSLQSIVLKCLAPDTGVRYSSAIELQEDVRRFREHRLLRYAPDRSWIERIQKFVRRHPTFISSSFLLMVAVSFFAALIATTLWNSERTKKLSAIALAHDLTIESPSIIAKLHAPSRDQQMMRVGSDDAIQILKKWGISEQGISSHSLLLKLSRPAAGGVKKDLGYMLYALASSEANLSTMTNEKSDKRLNASFAWSKLACIVDPSLSAAIAFQNAEVSKITVDQSTASAKSTALTHSLDLVSAAPKSLLGEMLLAKRQRDLPTWQRLADELVSQSPV